MTDNRFSGAAVRNDIARDIIAGVLAATPALAGTWRFIDTALADVPAVLAELGRVQAELDAARLERANLLAAIGATLDAWADGDANPLWYIRDELKASQMPPQDDRGAS